jgi:hypothetical protein
MKTELSLYIPNTETSTKLFYNVYPYRITYPRLGRIHRFYFQGNEPSKYSQEMRKNCLSYLKSRFKGRIKFNHGYHTHAYFLTEEDFEKAKAHEEFQTLHIKYTTPLFPDLKEILDKFDSNVQLRKNLFLRKFKYKVEIAFNFQNFPVLCDDLYSTFEDNPNYAVSGNIKSVTRRFGYYGSWATYSMYCKEKIDVEYFTFMFGENIKSITKAVLISELDK